MAIVVSDNFTRADDPSSLGTATTGQAWSNVPGQGNAIAGDPFGIQSNEAWWNRNGTGSPGADGLAAIETGLVGAKVSVKLMDVAAGGTLNLRNMGILFHYVDATHYIFASYAGAGGGLWRLYKADGSGTPTHVGPDSAAAPVNGDTMSVEFCGQEVTIKLNGVVAEGYPFTFFPVLSATLLAGTKCGLQAGGGVIDNPPYQMFDDFLVETNATCTPTYNCTVDGCVDPGDGSGEFGTLAACLTACEIAESYNCVEGVCIDPGDGSGAFPTLVECELSGCGFEPATVQTKRFDAGEGSSWYIIPPVIDSGNELRSKVVKSMRATGRLTDASMKAYGYDVNDEINTTDLEEGTNASTRAQDLPDSTHVAQGPRKQINVKNAVLSTVRLEGNDEGQEERDEIHEIVIEHSDQGVRR